MKSEYKPFSILRPQDNPHIDVYSGEIRRDISVFPWWNHWPTAQKPTDGRWAMADDKPAHGSLSHWFWDEYKVTEKSMTKLMLTGFTNKKIEELAPLGRSWYSPPKVSTSSAIDVVYNQAERCFDISMKEKKNELSFEIKASEASPVLNPAFVIRDWGNSDITLEINGKAVNKGKDFRVGHRQKLDGRDLVSWLRFESTETVKVAIKAK